MHDSKQRAAERRQRVGARLVDVRQAQEQALDGAQLGGPAAVLRVGADLDAGGQEVARIEAGNSLAGGGLGFLERLRTGGGAELEPLPCLAADEHLSPGRPPERGEARRVPVPPNSRLKRPDQPPTLAAHSAPDATPRCSEGKTLGGTLRRRSSRSRRAGDRHGGAGDRVFARPVGDDRVACQIDHLAAVRRDGSQDGVEGAPQNVRQLLDAAVFDRGVLLDQPGVAGDVRDQDGTIE